MEKNKLDQEIADYVYSNITPLKSQRKRIKRLYKELREFLGANKVFQTGSYARHTSIRPVNDLDVFCIHPASTSDVELKHSLSELCTNVDNNFRDVCSEEFEVTIQTHSIQIEFADNFSTDIIPAIETDIFTSDLDTPIYKVPVESSGEWVHSDPKGYKEITKRTDENSDKNFRRAVRFVKGCRQSCKKCDDEFKLKSFHIEQIFVEIFTENPNISLYDSIKDFFNDMPANLLSARFVDRADNTVYIDSYVNELTKERRDQIIHWSSNKLNQFLSLDSVSEEEIEGVLDRVISCSESDMEMKIEQENSQDSPFTPVGPHMTSC